MIACISPSPDDYQESINTLQYAAQARNIRNKPVIIHNKVIESVDLGNQKEVERALREEVRVLKEQLRGGGGTSGGKAADLMTKQLVNLQYASAEAKYLLTNLPKEHEITSKSLRDALASIADVLVDENTIAEDQSVAVLKRKDGQISKLREKVSNLERDLQRDEEIFAAKSKEIRTLQKHLHKAVKKIKEGAATVAAIPPTPPPSRSVSTPPSSRQLSEFHMKQRQFDREIQELTINISVKRDVIKTITKSKEDAQMLMQRHEERKRELGFRIEQLLEKQSEKLEGSVLSGSALSDDSFNNGGLEDDEELERSLEMAENELRSLSHQIKDQQRIVQLQKASARRIAELEDEVERMEGLKVKCENDAKELERAFEEERRVEPQPQSGSPGVEQNSKERRRGWDGEGGGDKENHGDEGSGEIKELKRQLGIEKRKNGELTESNLRLIKEAGERRGRAGGGGEGKSD